MCVVFNASAIRRHELIQKVTVLIDKYQSLLDLKSETTEGAAHSSYVRFLFGLICEHDGTTNTPMLQLGQEVLVKPPSTRRTALNDHS